MPTVNKKITKKKAVARRSTKAATAAAERLEAARWDAWERRIIRLAVQLLCVAGLANELLIEEDVSEPRLVFLATVLGLPTVISQARKIDQ